MRVRVGVGAVVWMGIVAGAALWRGMLSGDPVGELVSLPAVTAAAFLHEMGHILAARVVGVRVRGLGLALFGARLRLEGILSYGQEWLVAAGGPLVGFLTGGAALLAWQRWGGDPYGGLSLFGAASIVLGVVNLLPVRTLDGGRMLACGLALVGGERCASAVLAVTTGLCLGGMWLVAVYALLRMESLLSLFVFSLCLLLRCVTGEL